MTRFEILNSLKPNNDNREILFEHLLYYVYLITKTDGSLMVGCFDPSKISIDGNYNIWTIHLKNNLINIKYKDEKIQIVDGKDIEKISFLYCT